MQGLVTLLSGSNLQPATSYSVTAYPVGAVVSSDGSNTITTRVGHSICEGDDFLVVRKSGNSYSIVGLRTATVPGSGSYIDVTVSPYTIKYSGSDMTTQTGDLVINLGNDTSSTADVPNWDGSRLRIWSEPSGGSTAVSNSTVTSNSTSGEWEFWYEGDGACWMVVRNGSTIVDIIQGHEAVGGRINGIDYGLVSDRSTLNNLQFQQAAACASDLNQTLYTPGGDFVMGDVNGALDNNLNRIRIKGGTKILCNQDCLFVRKWQGQGASPSSTQIAMFVSDGLARGVATDGTYDEAIEWDGGRITVETGSDYGGSMMAIWSDFCSVKNLVIEEWGDNTVKGFGCATYGDYCLMENIRATSTVTATGASDGIHWSAGKYGKISNCHVESGDDCFTFSTWSGPTGTAGVDTEYGTLVNCSGVSAGGRVFVCATPANTTQAWATSSHGHRISNLVGTAYLAGVAMTHGNNNNTGAIYDVKFTNCHFDTDSGDTGEQCVDMNNDSTAGGTIYDVTFDNCHFVLGASAAPKQGYGARMNNSQRVRFLGCSWDATALNNGVDDFIKYVSGSTDGEVSNCTITFPTSSSMTSGITVVQLGSGSSGISGAKFSGNSIYNLPRPATSQTVTAFSIDEGELAEVSGNRVTLQSTIVYSDSVFGLVIGGDGGSGLEGKVVATGNNFHEWFDLEDAANTAGAECVARAIQINPSDSAHCIVGNLGYDLQGTGTYTGEGVTKTQATGTRLKHQYCILTVDADGDAFTLPFADYGRVITLVNNSQTNTARIFPAKGDNCGGGTDTNMFLNPLGTLEATITLVCRNRSYWSVANTQVDSFHSQNQGIRTFTASATPAVLPYVRNYRTNGTTTITSLNDGTPGQVIHVHVGGSNITISDNAVGAGNIYLRNSLDFDMVSADKDSLTLMCDNDGNWREVGRSQAGALPGSYTQGGATSRSFTASTATTEQLGDTLNTLIEDLKLQGILS